MKWWLSVTFLQLNEKEIFLNYCRLANCQMRWYAFNYPPEELEQIQHNQRRIRRDARSVSFDLGARAAHVMHLLAHGELWVDLNAKFFYKLHNMGLWATENKGKSNKLLWWYSTCPMALGSLLQRIFCAKSFSSTVKACEATGNSLLVYWSLWSLRIALGVL